MADENPEPKIDWERVEETLYQLTIAELKRVGEKYQGDPFYGFAFDVNADYGEVLLCLNSEGALEKSAQESSASPEPEWSRTLREKQEKKSGTKSEPPKRENVDHYLKKLRWSLGDWAHQGFESDAFKEGWSRFQEIISDGSIEAGRGDNGLNSVSQRFLICVCKVMTRLEKENTFTLISTTRNFETWVGDHEELDEWSIARLSAVREGKEKVLLKSWRGVREINI